MEGRRGRRRGVKTKIRVSGMELKVKGGREERKGVREGDLKLKGELEE